jgi:predicted outer membrane protein
MLFRGVKNKNVLKYAKVALEDVSKFNKIIRSLHINVNVYSITSLATKDSLFIAKPKLKLKYKEYIDVIRTNKALKLALYSL